MSNSLSLQNLEAAIEAIERPPIFYLPVHHCPCEDDDGQTVVFKILLPNDLEVCALHPSLQSQFIDAAKQAGLRAVQFDYGKQCPPQLMLDWWWEKILMESLKCQWKEHLIKKEGTNER